MIGIRFGLLSLAHLGRLTMRAEVLVAGHPLPRWLSVPTCLGLGGLGGWLWGLSHARTK